MKLIIALVLVALAVADSPPMPGSGCYSIKCGDDATCFEVGGPDCDNPSCPTTPKCIVNGGITCKKIQCAGPCLMVLTPGSYGSAGVPVPQCFPGNSYGPPHNDASDGGDQTNDVASDDAPQDDQGAYH